MKEEYSEVFKERLRMAMGKISQRDLAKMSGITEVSISRYLKGERIPKLTDAVTLAKALHTSLDYLSGLSDSPNIRDNRVIPLEKALEYCKNVSNSWRKFSKDALDNIGKGDSQGSSFGAVAFGEKNEVMYGYEIPNILKLLSEEYRGEQDGK